MFNTIKDKLHQSIKKMESQDHPLRYLFLELTRNCNLNCRHCGSDCIAQNDVPELSTDSWLKLLEDISLRIKPNPTIVLTGGEAILHKDFKKIVSKINSLKMRWGLVSNGYSLSGGKIEMLQNFNVYSITISIDGPKNSHNWIRRNPNSFSKALNALTHISESNIPIKDVVTCVNPRNLNELNDVAKILADLKGFSWRLFRIFPAGRASNNSDLQLTINQTGEMITWIESNRKKLSHKGVDLSLSCEGWLPQKINRRVRNQPFFCRAGINIASILCDGTITGCSNNYSTFHEGNVLHDSFSFVWQNRFKKFRDRAWVKETTCGDCSHLSSCDGGSIHLWRENDNKPKFCYMDCYR